MKKFFIICFTCLFICISSISVFATGNDQITDNYDIEIGPYWTYISLYLNTFDISSSGRADIEVLLEGRNVDKSKVEASLQQYRDGRWTTIKNWSKTSEDTYCSLGEAWYVNKGYYYRLLSTGTVYRNNSQVEQTTYTSPSKWY